MKGDAQFETVALVRFERTFPGPIERVWELLVTPSKLQEWFGNGTIEPREGGRVLLMDGHIRGVVTQWKPPRRLTYTWNAFSPGESESPYPESYLTIELEPHGEQVHLTLTHVPVPQRFERQNAMGWHTFLDLVDAALQDLRPARSTLMEQNARRYGVDLQNLVR